MASAAPSGMYHAQPVRSVIEGVEQWILMQAGQGIDRVEPVKQQGFDRGFGGAEAGHAGLSSDDGGAVTGVRSGR